MDFSKYIADHVKEIPRSGIRDFFEVVQSMTDVISLGIGEPDYVTPWRIREAAIFGMEKGRTGYTSNLGLPKLRNAIARYVERRYGVTYHPQDEILVSVGVSEALDLALRALLNPGDEVIFHEPSYVSYSPSVSLCYGKAVSVKTLAAHDFRLLAEDVARTVTPRTKALLLNFPTNPTGGVLRAEDLRPIAEICTQHDLIVLSDEIYSELIYDGTVHTSIASLPGMRDRTVLLNGCSKSFAMTGFRVGYACAPSPIIEAMMKIHQYSIMCASTMSQEAAIEAFENCQNEVEAMRSDYERRRNYVVSRFNEIGLPCHSPKGAFYVFPNITPTGLKSKDFSLRLLKSKRVAVVPGSAFGVSGEGFVRCCFATGLDKLKEAMVRIEQFANEAQR
ncbi:MAG TPA: aminotransferase class I/II-fold pyridoxal phosphate-dependent enzyme [Chthoniobacterales bacterium]|jgi:aminotransferase|nr:aminotransferase class I/II-fold pyridoxal phosphate-dependent enzyme [Chthoniobacterales bacterium]